MTDFVSWQGGQEGSWRGSHPQRQTRNLAAAQGGGLHQCGSFCLAAGAPGHAPARAAEHPGPTSLPRLPPLLQHVRAFLEAIVVIGPAFASTLV